MRVYFDYNATTPLAPEVVDAIARVSRETFGNASSVHQYGQQAKAVLDEARSAIAALAAIAHEHGALMHTDAVQSVGKIPVDVRALGVDLLSLSAHKFNGPKGVGVLFIKRGTRMQPAMTGGKHERNRRAGTENVPAIAGLGVAARLAAAKLGTEGPRLAALRNRLEEGVLRLVPGTAVNGS